jgi:hypothetical protein
MKKVLILLLFALNVSAQVTVQLPNGGKAATEEYLKTYFSSWLTRLNDPNTNPDPPVDPDPENQPCSPLPTISTVSNVAKTSLRLTFPSTSTTGTRPATNVNWFIYKTSAPGLNVKSGNLTFATTLNVGWTGDLEPGDYGIRIQATNCTATSSKVFTVASTPTNPICTSGPQIQNITSATRTTLTFTWAGLNVPEIVWNVRQNGSNIRSGSFVPGSSQTNTVSFTQLPYGSYELQLIGLTCSTINPGQSFTLTDPGTPSVSFGRQLIMNLTGFGFDPSQPNSIHPDWTPRIEKFVNMSWQGINFKGIDGIRVNMKWFDYEPTQGNFRDDKVLVLLDYCKQRGLKLSIALIPWRREGDGMFPDSHKARVSDGKIWYEEGDLPSTYKTYQPSIHSTDAQAKFKNAAKHLSQLLKQNGPANVDYISTAMSQTEEYQLIRQESPLLMSGYADIDKQLWNSYSGGLQVPYANSSDLNVINQMMDSPTGKKWYEFHTEGLRIFHAAFVQGVREGGMRACGMYAGIGAPSGVFDFTYKFNTIYSAGTADQPDIMYSSEGDAGSQMSKQMATDLNIGTFPGAEPAIEFDPEDVAANQIRNPPYGIDLNGQILYEHSVSFFRRGGKLVHFAMSFHPDKINQLAEAVYKLRNEFINSSSGMASVEQGQTIYFPIFRYSGLQEYRGEWSTRGGGLTKQVKIVLQNANETPPNGTAITNYLNSNSGPYNDNLRFEIRKSNQGSIFNFSKGSIGADQQVSVMSLSKATTAATLLAARDRGLVNIDATVGSYIPSWNSGDKASITIRQVVTHKSGIRDETNYDGHPTLAQAVDGMAGTPLDFTPGTSFKYSTTSYQVLARIVEIVTGKTFKQAFNEYVRDKCGMGNAEYNPTGPGPIYGNPLNPNAGAGLWCTQNESSNFMMMIRDNGSFNGVTVLSPDAINLICSDQGNGWGFGMVRNDNGNEPTAESAKGCYAWVNRAKGLSCVLFTQSEYSPTIGINNGLRDLTRNTF